MLGASVLAASVEGLEALVIASAAAVGDLSDQYRESIGTASALELVL